MSFTEAWYICFIVQYSEFLWSPSATLDFCTNDEKGRSYILISCLSSRKVTTTVAGCHVEFLFKKPWSFPRSLEPMSSPVWRIFKKKKQKKEKTRVPIIVPRKLATKFSKKKKKNKKTKENTSIYQDRLLERSNRRWRALPLKEQKWNYYVEYK